MKLSRSLLAGLALVAGVTTSLAELKLPSIFGSHMVLQRNHANPVWGKADPGAKVFVVIDGQTKSTKADAKGNWEVKLDPMKVGKPRKLVIESNKDRLQYDDVLVGEVWVCSGQSNMAWPVSVSNDADLEKLTAKYPNIRLISVPQVGTQEEQWDFKGQWDKCTPETVANFSAVGYYFGRTLHQSLDIPIGLIDNAWGGSAAEAWVKRSELEADPVFNDLVAKWEQTEKTYDWDKIKASYDKKLADWQVKYKEAKKKGAKLPNRPRAPRNVLAGQHRPGNLYAGVLKPTIGYGIRGAIWYQGESNAGRAYQYRHLFPKMIQHWRDEWKQGDFPFYWVQLADFRDEVTEPGDSSWGELREAQTMTMSKLKNTGEAVIIDAGEGRDIHPRNKQTVAKRLARWALAKDYGMKVPYQSPAYKSMEIKGNKALLSFDHVGSTLYTFDVRNPVGFAIAGADQKFVNANAKLVGKDKIEVWSDSVSKPVAVRYGWAENPVCNVQSREGLPMNPFRTDNWKGITADVTK